MAIYYESLCVDCGFPCLREACPYYKVLRYSCDFCGKTEEDVDMAIANDKEAICEDCKHKIDIENLRLVKEMLYEWYVNDWLSSRNLTHEDIDDETGVKEGEYKGCMYACMAEFLMNEYDDDKFLDYLCQQNGYKDLGEIIKKYDIEDVI